MKRPAKEAPRGDWDQYAESIGVDPNEYSNKEGLIDAVEAELLLREDDEENDDEAPEDETSEDTPEAEVDEGDFEHKAPEGHEDSPASWRRAYDHARKKGNPEKTSILYANAHFQDEEFSG